MAGLARIGDVCGNGTIMTGSPDVFIEGRPAAVIGSVVSPHPYGDSTHNAVIQTGSNSVFINGIPAAQLGSVATCSVHNIITASGSVNGG